MKRIGNLWLEKLTVVRSFHSSILYCYLCQKKIKNSINFITLTLDHMLQLQFNSSKKNRWQIGKGVCASSQILQKIMQKWKNEKSLTFPPIFVFLSPRLNRAELASGQKEILARSLFPFSCPMIETKSK